jgi:hypothetical protein
MDDDGLREDCPDAQPRSPTDLLMVVQYIYDCFQDAVLGC